MNKKWLLGFATGLGLLACSGSAFAQTATPANTATPVPTATSTYPPINATPQPRNSGRLLSLQTAATNMKFLNTGGNCILVVKNADSNPTTVTVDSVAEAQFGRTGDAALVVTAGSIGVLGPFRPAGFNQKTSDKGYIHVNFTNVTTVTTDLVCFIQ